jgi:hypothetical protein
MSDPKAVKATYRKVFAAVNATKAGEAPGRTFEGWVRFTIDTYEALISISPEDTP